jgi:hypothetical protein
LTPVFNELGVLGRHLANAAASSYRNHTVVLAVFDELKKTLARPEGSSLGILNSMEIQHEIKNGNAMREHQLRRRDRENADLTTRLTLAQGALSQLKKTNETYRKEINLLTTELRALRVTPNESKSNTRKTRLGSTGPGRKSPRAKAAKRVAKTV